MGVKCVFSPHSDPIIPVFEFIAVEASRDYMGAFAENDVCAEFRRKQLHLVEEHQFSSFLVIYI